MSDTTDRLEALCNAAPGLLMFARAELLEFSAACFRDGARAVLMLSDVPPEEIEELVFAIVPDDVIDAIVADEPDKEGLS